MSKFNLMFKALFKNRKLCFMTVVFLLVATFYIIYTTVQCNRYSLEPLFYLNGYLKFSLYEYVFFSFISYEYLFCLKRQKTEELLKTTKNGYAEYYFYGVLVLIALLGILTAIFICFNIFVFFFTKIGYAEYLWKMIFLNLFYFFLVPFIGILVGTLLSFFRYRILSYLILVSLIFIVSPVFEMIAQLFYDIYGVNFYNFSSLFNIFPDNLSWTPIPSIGYFPSLNKCCIGVFWIFVLFMAVEFFVRRKKIRPLRFLLCLLIATSTLVFYFLPASEVLLNDDPQKGAVADARYYNDASFVNKEQVADFEITEYEMEFVLKKQLAATVKMYLSQSESKEYFFTLYHGYLIDSVVTDSGELLDFEQTSDYFTVDAKGKELKTITVTYSGSSPHFFANSQGCSLPGWFSYYPIAGFHSLFNTKNQSHNRIFSDFQTIFTVKVISPKQVYCNLPKVDDNHFQGRAEGITMVSGYYDCAEVGNVEVVYPYLSVNVNNRQQLEQSIRSMQQKGYINDIADKVIIISNVNLISANEMCCIFKEHIAASSLEAILAYAPMQSIMTQKQELYTAYTLFCEQPEEFFAFADLRRADNDALGLSNEEDIYVLLASKLSNNNEEFIKAEIRKYLEDDDELMDGIAFLQQLGV